MELQPWLHWRPVINRSHARSVLLSEEEENDHGRSCDLRPKARQSGGPAGSGHAVLLRQTLRHRAGGAETGRWVSHNYWSPGVQLDPLRSLLVLCHDPDSSFLSSNDLTHTLSSYLKQGEQRSNFWWNPVPFFCIWGFSCVCFCFLKFVPSGQKSKSSTRRPVLLLFSSFAALRFEPSSYSSKWAGLLWG